MGIRFDRVELDFDRFRERSLLSAMSASVQELADRPPRSFGVLLEQDLPLRALFDFSWTTTVAPDAARKRLLIANGVVSTCFGLLLLMNVPEDTAAAYGLAFCALISGVIPFETAP